MEQNVAIEILIEVANLAQSKGVLSLDGAVAVAQAIQSLKAKPEPKKESQPVKTLKK